MFAGVVALALLIQAPPGPAGFRVVRSLSGPSGREEAGRFVIDETRNRFVYPADKSLVVLFEWEGPVGRHAITGRWKNPEGRIASISADINLEARTRNFSAYWTFTFGPTTAPGVWELDVRIDGEPAGSHAFELVVAQAPPAPEPPAPPRRKLPSMDELFQLSRSLVTVHRLDDTGKPFDPASGFVIGKDRVLTAFQAIDGAAALELEFAAGRRVPVQAVLGCDRMQDWALLEAGTAAVPPLKRGDAKEVPIGERLVVFNPESAGRVIGGVDVVGRRNVPGFGPRLLFSPSLAAAAIGGPVLDGYGDVVGIVGGGFVPGFRASAQTSLSGTLYSSLHMVTTALPLALVPENPPAAPQSLKELAAAGVLTPALRPFPSLVSCGTTKSLNKDPSATMAADASEFSRHDPEVWVYSFLLRKEKIKSGMLSALVYDAKNRVRITVAARKTNLPSAAPARAAFSFSPSLLDPGIYRIDLRWDDQPIWRTFIEIK